MSKIEYPKIRLFKQSSVDGYLEASLGVSEWIKRYEVEKESGKSWKLSSGEGSSDGDQLAAKLNDRTIYSGAAGIGYFYVQLFEVTGKDEYLQEAIAAGEYLISTFHEELGKKPGIHTGLAGEGLFAELLYKKTGDIKYREYAIKAGRTIYNQAIKEADGLHWESLIDYMGDGSAIAYWIYLAGVTKDNSFLEYAKEGIDYILTLKTDYEDDTLYWKFFDMHDYFDEIPAGGIIPNFAHGTAGIVYILTKYYEASGDEKYLDYAKKGFKFLKNIAIHDGEASIVPYLYLKDSDKPFDLFYLSLCHGPVGDAVVAKELYKATDDKEYLEFYHRLSNALIKADVSKKRSPGYWNDCVCCGASGVLLHFIDGYRFTGDEAYKEYAREIADKLVGDAYKDDKGIRWYNAWTRVMPWNVDSHLGLYIGAAGSASALLSLYGALENVPVTQLYEFSD